jgi:hypothetical protein
VVLHRCPECEAPFTSENKRKIYCSTTCRVRANKAGRSQGNVTAIGRRKPAGPGRNELATRATLESIGQLDSVLGALAITLAIELDSTEVPGPAKTQMSREMRQLMVEARAMGAAPAGSHTDEIRRKREERRARGA